MKVVLFLMKCLLVIITSMSAVLLGLYIYAQFSGPVGPIPGAKLNGEYSSSKPDWKALLLDGKFIEAQFDPKNPYSVTLAPHMIDDELYTWSRAPNSWSSLIDEDHRVVVRIDGVLYRTLASKVDDDFLLGLVNEERAGERVAVGISFHLRREK